MKSTRLWRRLTVVVAVLLIFGAAGIPSVSAADDAIDIGVRSYTVGNGTFIFTGSTNTNHIKVSDYATASITLRSVSISSAASALDLGTGASVLLLLEGSNTLTSTGGAGIHVPISATLTISQVPSGGSVTVLGSDYYAGIGGNSLENAGIVNISGGVVTATGGINAAGIGGGADGNGGTVNISGGTVTANGASFGAGIGGGANGSGGTVNISGGTVTANGGAFMFNGISYGGVGIGGGSNAAGGIVTISGSNTYVTAKGGMAGLDIGAGGGETPENGGTLSVSDGAHLTLLTGMTNILPANVSITNCTVDDKGTTGFYTFPKKPPVPPVSPAAANASDAVKSEAPVFLRSTSGSGVEIDVSALALPAGVTLISNDFSGLSTQAAGKTWTLSHKLAGTNGSFHGKDYLALYDFTLTDENGKLITGYLGRLTVRLPVPSGSKGNLHVLYYDESGKQFTEVMAVPDNGYLTFSTTHFSSYLVTGTGATGEKPAIPETGATSFPYLGACVVLVLTLFTVYIVRKRQKTNP